MIDVASDQMRAMICLGVNGGMGDTDCGRLPWSAVDFESGWATFPRPKTGVGREIPLWDETLDALRRVRAETGEGRPVFVTRFGRPWTNSAVAHEFRKLTRRVGARRECVGFYSLRHTFATIASASLDQPAVDAIMGHCDPSVAAIYRQEIEDERLIRVVEFVRGRVLR